MVFKSVNFCSGEVTSYYCNGQFSPSPNMQSISITGLTPGETYYLMVDGFAGDVCDYTFIANSGVSVPVSIDPDETTLCLGRSEEHTSELQSRPHLVCRLLLEKKKRKNTPQLNYRRVLFSFFTFFINIHR